MHHDPSDLGSLILIQITPKERTLSYTINYSMGNSHNFQYRSWVATKIIYPEKNVAN